MGDKSHNLLFCSVPPVSSPIPEIKSSFVQIAAQCPVPNAYCRYVELSINLREIILHYNFSGKRPMRDCHAKILRLGKKPTTPIIKPKGLRNICKNTEFNAPVANFDTLSPKVVVCISHAPNANSNFASAVKDPLKWASNVEKVRRAQKWAFMPTTPATAFFT